VVVSKYRGTLNVFSQGLEKAILNLVAAGLLGMIKISFAIIHELQGLRQYLNVFVGNATNTQHHQNRPHIQ
jgi:hypothetical protein